jgi:hypothetical protein
MLATDGEPSVAVESAGWSAALATIGRGGEGAVTRHEIDVHFLGGSVLKGPAAHRRRDQADGPVKKETPMARSNRAHDAKARAREARAVMLAERQAQDERIEHAMASALLAIEDRDAAQAEVERQERTLAAALQKLNLESVTVRDTMTMTGLSEKYVTRPPAGRTPMTWDKPSLQT